MCEVPLTNEQINILVGALNVYIEKLQNQESLDESLMDVLDESIFLQNLIKRIAKKQHVDYRIIIE
jgi:conjugal transfer/entry exclusion protein